MCTGDEQFLPFFSVVKKVTKSLLCFLFERTLLWCNMSFFCRWVAVLYLEHYLGATLSCPFLNHSNSNSLVLMTCAIQCRKVSYRKSVVSCCVRARVCVPFRSRYLSYISNNSSGQFNTICGASFPA